MELQEIAHVIDAETVHNWVPRYKDLPHYADLSQSAAAAVLRAHVRYHKNGKTAREAAEELAEKYPAEFILTKIG